MGRRPDLLLCDRWVCVCPGKGGRRVLFLPMWGRACESLTAICLKSRFPRHGSVFSCEKNGCCFEMPIVDVKSHSNLFPVTGGVTLLSRWYRNNLNYRTNYVPTLAPSSQILTFDIEVIKQTGFSGGLEVVKKTGYGYSVKCVIVNRSNSG